MNQNESNAETRHMKYTEHPVFQITKTSKYFALVLFIIMPFVGGWVGYNLASIPTTVIEIKTSNTEVAERAQALTINSAKVVNEGDMEVSFSNNVKKIVAVAKKPGSVENYFEIETYREAFISPNRKFVALQGTEFEDTFVRIYNAEEDRLEDKMYGEVMDWDNIGRLGILSCNLAGEECTSYISVSSKTPWVLEEVAQ